MANEDSAEENPMPNLADLQGQMVPLIVKGVRGGTPKDPRAWSLWVQFVRLIQKAVTEYQFARAALDRYKQADPTTFAVSDLTLMNGHLESCINAMARAIKFGRAMRSAGREAAAPISRREKILSERVASRVRLLRDGLEHLDKHILAGDVPDNPMLTMGTDDFIALRGERVLYSELAEWLRNLHLLARKVAG